MIVICIVIVILILISLIRFGVTAEYGADGLIVTAEAGPFSIRAFPREAKPEKADKKALRKARKEKKAKKKPVQKKPGKLRAFLDMIPALKKALSRLRRRLRVKKLTIYYVAAGDDAAVTALSFGAANAVLEMISPALEDRFRVKRRDFRTYADFQAAEQSIYIEASLSIAVWEAVYIALAMVPVLIKR